ECAVRTGEQVVGASVEREWAVRRGGQQRLKFLALRDERRRSRSHQRVDQVLLPRGGLQDRRIGQDRRETRFAPDQSLVGRKEEYPVFHDRTAECEAWLVAPEGRILPHRPGEGVARVEHLVAEIVIEVSVK